LSFPSSTLPPTFILNQHNQWSSSSNSNQYHHASIPPILIPHSSAAFDPRSQNEAVTKWASMVQRRLRDSAIRFSHGKDGTIIRPGRSETKLRGSIKGSTSKQYGVIDRASIIFERHGVFVHKGVGRGYHMQGGTVIRTAKLQVPNPRPRTAHEWFNPIIEQSLPKLADKLAEINADAVVNATRMIIR
jgi:hypothetical protein